MTRDELASEWLHHAAEDYRAAAHLTGLRPQPSEIICFHSQQAAEKSLKAMLVASNIRPPRTHDLEELSRLVGSAATNPGLEEAVLLLNPYSVVTRYPNPMDFSEGDAQDAIAAARVVLEAARREVEST